MDSFFPTVDPMSSQWMASREFNWIASPSLIYIGIGLCRLMRRLSDNVDNKHLWIPYFISVSLADDVGTLAFVSNVCIPIARLPKLTVFSCLPTSLLCRFSVEWQLTRSRCVHVQYVAYACVCVCPYACACLCMYGYALAWPYNEWYSQPLLGAGEQ